MNDLFLQVSIYATVTLVFSLFLRSIRSINKFKPTAGSDFKLSQELKEAYGEYYVLSLFLIGTFVAVVGTLSYYCFKIIASAYLTYVFADQTIIAQSSINYVFVAGLFSIGIFYYPQKVFFLRMYGEEKMQEILKVSDQLQGINSDYGGKILTNFFILASMFFFALSLRATHNIDTQGNLTINSWGLKRRVYQSTDISKIVQYKYLKTPKQDLKLQDSYDIFFKDSFAW